jgi:hypothetical protein
MRYDDNFSPQEIRLMNELKKKSRMEQDQILAEHEKEHKNGKL